MRIIVVSAGLTLGAAVSLLPLQVASAQPPSTTVIIPSNNATASGTSQVLDATASPGVTQVQYAITGGTQTNSVIATATPTLYGWIALWNTTAVPNGTYTLQSVALSGGVTGTSPPVSLTVINPPPSTTMLVPANGATQSQVDPLVMDAWAPAGVTQVVFNGTSGGGGIPFSVTATPTIYGWIGVIPGTPIPQSSCGPIPLPYSIDSVASYSGGVSGTSAPVNITIDVWVPASGCF
jgi:hypothetical protein